jgi:hypothetical protein
MSRERAREKKRFMWLHVELLCNLKTGTRYTKVM